MKQVVAVALAVMAVVSCRGSDSKVKLTVTTFDPKLAEVPSNLPDKEPEKNIGGAYTAYGLWGATQDPNLAAKIKDSEVRVRGYIVNVSMPARTRGEVELTPHVWIADQPSRKGLYFAATGYADSYVAMEEAAAYDKCIEACTKAKGDPAAEAASTPGRYSKTFGACLTDVRECRDLFEANPRANFFKLAGAILKWYVRDQIFGSDKRKAIEDELRGMGNVICEAGPAQRRLMVTILVASVLGFDLEKFRRDVGREIKEKYPGRRVEQLEPSILQEISNRRLEILDDPQNVRKVYDAIRAIRAGTDDGSTLGAHRGLGAAWRSALAKGGTQGVSGVTTDARKVANDLLDDIMYRWFWSKADTKRAANMACVFDDLLDFTSDRLDPIKLITRRRVMLGPQPDTTWEQAMASGRQFEIQARFASRSRTGFIGWTLDILPSMVCAHRANCPDYINPVFGTVYEFKFGEASASTP